MKLRNLFILFIVVKRILSKILHKTDIKLYDDEAIRILKDPKRLKKLHKQIKKGNYIVKL
jgi:hypothetical protein